MSLAKTLSAAVLAFFLISNAFGEGMVFSQSQTTHRVPEIDPETEVPDTATLAVWRREGTTVPLGPKVRARFFREVEVPRGSEDEVPPPSFEGKVVVRDEVGGWRQVGPFPGDSPGASRSAAADIFLADGSENALAIDIGNGDNLVAVFNQGYSNTPSMKTSANGNVSWTTRTFPNGGGTYTGSPYDPWANAGNAAGELYATLIRRDTASDNTHCVIARSANGGLTWSLFFERIRDVFQDREMVDIDRTSALGGGAGATHDGNVYLCYDNFGVDGAGYAASYLQVVSPAGTALNEIRISSSSNFRGNKLQPVSGVVDGQVYLMGLTTTLAGANRRLLFHEATNAGANVAYYRSSMTFPTTGQKLGATTRYGVNGHRINSHMFMDIDLTEGPHRGTLYVISNRNPNPSDSSLDQGDVYLSRSTDGASSWTSALIPTVAENKTQFFSMLDVDENGWLHVAYYQNETGSVDDGVLNASSANVYYTMSLDGGTSWTPAVMVNGVGDTLDYFDPPPDLASRNYYLIGDYCQIKATGMGPDTKIHVFWTGYDKDRSNLYLNDKRERAICTTLTMPPLCGDNVVNQPNEECDGTDNATCPLTCYSNCRCCDGDVISPFDGHPDALDVAAVASCVDGGSCNCTPDCDVNGDGCVDGVDIVTAACLTLAYPDLSCCAPPFAPFKEADHSDKNRYISLKVSECTGEETALRVNLASLHHPVDPVHPPPDFTAYENRDRYINAITMCRGGTAPAAADREPGDVRCDNQADCDARSFCMGGAEPGGVLCAEQADCDARGLGGVCAAVGGTCEQMHTCVGGTESGGILCGSQEDCTDRGLGGTCQASMTCPDSEVFGTTFTCAKLSCTPEYRDWGSALAGETLHVTGAAIVPSSEYVVDQLASDCRGQEASCTAVSEALMILTAIGGNVDDNPMLSVTDVAETVDHLKGVTGALIKPRVHLRPNVPDAAAENVTVLDAATVVDALKDRPYGFTGDFGPCTDACPGEDPCP